MTRLTVAPRAASAALVLLLAHLAVLALRQGVLLDGLRAGGLNGKPPPNAALITTLVEQMTSNWLWLVLTGVGLVAVLAGGMMAFGSQRAPDVLFRIVAGIGLILIVIPSALA